MALTSLRRLLALTCCVLLAAGCARGGGESDAGSTNGGVVRTAAGLVRGVTATDYRFFAGIPYAAPPVGPLRWQPPAPVQPWAGLRDAIRPGARCIQDSETDVERGHNTSEDCLTLNVWTPPASKEARPVLVWIHGGGFVNGSSDVYDARRLTNRGDIIVVTINYRLGALGFLAHPALGPAGQIGNYGLADQQAALRWVHDNIADFGGDPDKVTLAGESAGGISVCDHLVAPGSAGLFRAAIMHSAPCQSQGTRDEAEKVSLDYAAKLGCGDPMTAGKCLHDLPVDKLHKPPYYYRFGKDLLLTGPITATDALPVDPISGFADGRAARVPVLIGSNRDEATLFLATWMLQLGESFTVENYPRQLAETFGDNAAKVGERYPLERFKGSAPLALSAAVTDAVFACVTDRMSEDLVKDQPVYAYEFNDRDAPAPESLRQLPFPLGASHSLELRYLFDIGDAPPLSPSQRALSDQMIDYWSQFVITGSPSAAGQPEWPEIGDDARAGKYLSLQPDGSRVVTTFEQEHQCAFWSSVKG
ncbi:MAG: carboxylesterase/lipase family protein [Mycobacterium sp.]|jgi:para-nitrobenzyl esterase|uniref:carboxylesterase/lipase family protein n=1 Tax=Mycobacterium sp. TaxID=1785 RepID=UPI0038998714